MGDEAEGIRQYASDAMQARHRRRTASDAEKRDRSEEERAVQRLARAEAERQEEDAGVAMVVHDRRSAVTAAGDTLERRLHHQLYDALDGPTHPSTYDVSGRGNNLGALRYSVAIIAAFLADFESDEERGAVAANHA